MASDVDKKASAELRKIPKVDQLASRLQVEQPLELRITASRAVLNEVREDVISGASVPGDSTLEARASEWLKRLVRRRLTVVINATGVLLHTNLGRTPLSQRAAEAVSMLSASYTNLEFDLQEGRRGSRNDRASDLLIELTGAASALVVNNNAAAVTLALSALAGGREVVVSRGELVEIGGEFRIPEILGVSGARLVEVGTTNRTHLADYRKAIGEETGAILKVHPSNYEVVGFTAEVTTAELSQLASDARIPFLYDLGSGLVRRIVAGQEIGWLKGEPSVAEALNDGADLVSFSGDKLLGGPQAGIVVGRRDLIAEMATSPLARALRPDKMTLAALEATLLAWLEGKEGELPLWRMALASSDEIGRRATDLETQLKSASATVRTLPGFSAAGGGAGNASQIPTVLVGMTPAESSCSEVLRRLVDSDPPVLARVVKDEVLVDLRTVLEEQDALVAEALRRAL